ncbi:MAG: hypothetical protein NZ555_11065 [Geminicoccaceae bacterium]|nr:hypothetical protein [Geminicoccaceae bacterium]MDW8371175.1 hypothetical protein [Geminicoccaceae bacterium]
MAQPMPKPAGEAHEAPPAAEPEGDPVADYVAMWLALDLFHERGRLTEEGWGFLVEHLQRPLELRLLERTPVTLDGAMRALTMASHIMDHLDQWGSDGQRAWYRRLRNHLVRGARDCLERRLHAEAARRASEAAS